ncbi:MAG TPA: biotin synthase, partial [Oscillospiraceae bacterium]|nr:biotin synthase [Oscillospiraceae bacterium]
YSGNAQKHFIRRGIYFNPFLDPKCNWAIHHMELFPVEVNTAPYEMLLRVPGIGVTSAKRILTARKVRSLDFDGLKKIGVVLKRAQYFIVCNGKKAQGLKITESAILRELMSESAVKNFDADGNFIQTKQLSFFDPEPSKEDYLKCLTGQM